MIQIIPAIDLRNGKVVRLTRGDFSRETVYSAAPEEVAKKWELEGATMIHVVDLDGALSGKRKNLGSLKNICSVAKIPIQFGGGLRSLESIREVFSVGVSRAVVGTKALDLKLLKQMINRFGNRIVVGLDVRNGNIQTHGWSKQVQVVKIDSFCTEIEKVGVKHLVYTDVSRDGTLLGPNLEMLQKLATHTKLNVIMSGGISKLKDIGAIKALRCTHISGIIVGKALYERRFTLTEAIAVAKGKTPHE